MALTAPSTPWLLAVALLAGVAGITASTAAAADSAGAAGGSPWTAYGATHGGGHYQAADQITPGNVGALKVAWTHRSGDFRGGKAGMTEEIRLDGERPSNFMVTPIVARGTLYYCTPFNRVYALDPATGAERWMFDPEVDMGREVLTNCRGVSSWEDPVAPDAPCGHRILLGTLDGRLVALDGATGQRCPDFGRDGEVDLTAGLSAHAADEYGVTSPPAILGDTLVVGAFVVDSRRADSPSGVVRAYDVRTGAFRWGWNPVPPDADATDADGNYVAGTTNVWSIIAADPARNLVIVPTGNSSPDYYGGDRDGRLDHYSSSVVALDGTTGAVRWHFQTVHHDIWDYDVPAQPTLVDLTIDGRTRAAVVQVTKMGLTFVLDRDTGEPLHPVEERPVPQAGAVPGEYLSPTQPFPVRPPPLHALGMTPDDAWGVTFWDEGACRDTLEAMATGPIYTPPSLQGTVFYPSNLGGNNWGAPAVDPERQVMVVNTKHLPMGVRLIPRAQCDASSGAWPQAGSPYCVAITPVVSPLGAPCSAPPWATLAAVDLAAGTLLWQRPLGDLTNLAPWPVSKLIEGGVEMGGPMVTGSGLVFIAATADARLRAFDIGTGAELWSDELPTSGNAVPMSYVADGRQFVVIAAGGHFTSPTPAGDWLVAYALDPPAAAAATTPPATGATVAEAAAAAANTTATATASATE